MDKITGIAEGIQISQTKNLRTTDTDHFKKVLDKTFENKETTEAAKTSVSSLGEIKSPFLDIDDVTLDVEQKTEELISRLDQYAKDLENPRKTLKEIEPVIRGIRDDAKRLVEEQDQWSQDNEPLKKIATEFAVMANVEYLKLTRGDYL